MPRVNDERAAAHDRRERARRSGATGSGAGSRAARTHKSCAVILAPTLVRAIVRWAEMSSWTGMSSTGATDDQAPTAEPRRNRIGIGKIIVLSLGVGLAAAVLLPFIPWPTVDANFATAMVLFGFAVGWALLAVLSVRLTDQPQRWAYTPALFMGVGAVLLLFLPNAVLGALEWVWPPALLVLVAWVYRHAKRDLRSRSRTWLLNPVLAVLVLFA